MPATPLLRRPLFWVGVLYFAEGLPLGLYYDLLPVYLRAQGAPLETIGLLGPLGLAWTLKFLWAPAVDRLRAHRRWMFAVDAAMALTLAGLAAGPPPLGAALGACALLAWLSATNDIAVDAYTIEHLPRAALGRGNGVRIALYRVGMLAAGGLLVLADRYGWSLSFLAAAGLLLAAAVACRVAPAEAARPAPPPQTAPPASARKGGQALAAAALASGLGWLAARQFVADTAVAWLVGGAAGLGVGALLVLRRNAGAAAPYVAMLSRRGMLAVALFALLYKAGDAAMGLMVKPFWLDAGFSLAAIGLVSVNLGLGLSVAGGLLGGWLTDRLGMLRAVWMLGLTQAASNLGYAWAASVIPLGAGPGEGRSAILYGASMVESFTGGLGTAAFLALLMAVVDRRRAATEYALLSSLFALSRALAGWAGGYGAATLGYAEFFLLTAAVGLPALVLVPALRPALRAPPGQD